MPATMLFQHDGSTTRFSNGGRAAGTYSGTYLNSERRGLPGVFIDGSGGTIASVPSPVGRQAKLSLDEIVDMLAPELRNYVHLVCLAPQTGEGCEEMIDSTEADHQHFVRCARVHYRQMRGRGVVGQVHLTGTDTLEQKAVRMALMLRNANMPVVITGSQRGVDERWSDAAKNLRDAVYAAGHPDMPPGVWVIFNGRIIDPRLVAKRSSADVDAFTSVNGADVGEIEAPHHFRVSRTFCQDAADEAPLFMPEFELGVKTEVITPDYQPAWLDAVLARQDVRGLVLRGYGLGNIPSRLLPSLREWAETKPIVVGTQCFDGPANLRKYQVGELARRTGVLSAGNLSPAYTLSLLQWLMARIQDVEQLKSVWESTVYSALSPGMPAAIDLTIGESALDAAIA